MKIARTCPANQWAADAFWEYVAKEVVHAGADDLSLHTKVLAATLEHAIPAGNA